MAGHGSHIYDELLCFLGDPIFQIPVRTFMDENCLIFDPSLKPGKEHEVVHAKYKKLIDALLDGFCRDAKITTEQAIQGVNKISQIPDLREVFHTLFEQVLGATDFNVFCQVMIKRNIMIQEQVLVMIIAATGSLPESLMGKEAAAKKGSAPVTVVTGADDKQEEDLLKQIMRQSKDEHEQKASVQKKRVEHELSKTLEISKHQAAALQHERQQLEQGMTNLALSSSVAVAGSSPFPMSTSASVPKAGPATSKLQQPVKLPPSVVSTSSKAVSGAQAANQWLQDAQAEKGTSSAHSAMAASLSQLSPEELKKRQEFLCQQRDKLLAKKKEAREKQLSVAEKERPTRPQSARAARNAMNRDADANKPSKEDAAKLAMRRAIADKLRAEVIGKDQ